MSIAENYYKLRKEVPDHVTIVLACKKRTSQEILQAIDAGATDIGDNYVQEAEKKHIALANNAKRVKWHMIGHLQENKINKAIQIFDVIETIDSLKKAIAIDKRLGNINKIMPVFIEINIADEPNKSGIRPDYPTIENLIIEMSKLKYVRLEGLMTMGSLVDAAEDLRHFFKKAKEIFDKIKALQLPGVSMKYLSMGMSDSYKIGIEEGANMIRVGTIVFGARK